MDMKQGEVILLSSINPIMTEEAFEALLVGKSSNTTIPIMRRARAFIVRGILTRGLDRKGLGDGREIIAGTYNSDDGVLARVFLVENQDRATLLWQGPSSQFRPNYMRIRDELAGRVPYRLYGRAAATKSEIAQTDFKTVLDSGRQEEQRIPLPRKAPEETLQLSEKQFEDILAKYPELIESGLSLRGRQVNLSGKILDLLFEDQRGDVLIVELKKGAIKREHIAQLLDYEGFFVSEFNPTTRVMLIGNHVPKNLQNSLDHHGIEYKFFSPSTLKEFLVEKADRNLLDSMGCGACQRH